MCPHFDGSTYNAGQDWHRLTKQLDRVRGYMLEHGGWRTLREISVATGHPEASVSARLRDLRKPKFGGYIMNSRRRINASRPGTWEYQVEEP